MSPNDRRALLPLMTLARQSDKDEILRRLKALDAGSVRRWGRMSAHQMVCHLADALRMAAGRKLARPSGGLFAHTALKWVVLYVPLRWPAGIPTSPEIDQQREGTPPREFATDVAELEALLELVSSPARRLHPDHPRFGRMSDRAWLRWAYLHTDHHLRQFGA